LIATLVWPDGSESRPRADPDGSNGAPEWAIVAATSVIAVAVAMLSRREPLRPRLVAA
jgi:hypothetical protein